MSVKKTSFSIDSNLLKRLKFKAVEMDTTQTELLTEYLKEGLEKEINKTKTKAMKLPKARIINHEMPFYDPNYKGNLKNIIGTVELGEKTDAVELKKEFTQIKQIFNNDIL